MAGSFMFVFCYFYAKSVPNYVKLLIQIVHWCSELKVQPALLLSFFVHNSSINELMSMKLREHICYEKINWILYYCGFRNNL